MRGSGQVGDAKLGPCLPLRPGDAGSPVWTTFLLVTVGLSVGPLTERAHAEGTATTFVVDATVNREGLLTVEQTMTFAAPVPAQVSQRFETERDLVGDRRQVFTMGDFSATAQGNETELQIERAGRFTTVAISTNGANQVILRYTVAGAVVTTDTGTALQWRLLQGLERAGDRLRRDRGHPRSVHLHRLRRGKSQLRDPVPLLGGGLRGGTGADVQGRSPRRG